MAHPRVPKRFIGAKARGSKWGELYQNCPGATDSVGASLLWIPEPQETPTDLTTFYHSALDGVATYKRGPTPHLTTHEMDRTEWNDEVLVLFGISACVHRPFFRLPSRGCLRPSGQLGLRHFALV